MKSSNKEALTKSEILKKQEEVERNARAALTNKFHALCNDNRDKIKSRKITAADLVNKFEEHRDPLTAAELLLVLKDIKTCEYENLNYYIQEIESYKMDDSRFKEVQHDKIARLKSDALIIGSTIADLDFEAKLYKNRMTNEIRKRKDVIAKFVIDILFNEG